MASRQTGSDKAFGNGTNTAVYIVNIKKDQHSEEDLKSLAETCFKSNNPLTLYVSSKIPKELLFGLEQEGKVTIFQGDNFPEDIKNVAPLSLPLSNEPNLICKWIINSNKYFNGSNLLVANGKNNPKSDFFQKHLSYWSNFFPKLFTGANANLNTCEAIIMSKTDFHELVLEKKIDNAWQIAAIAEKSEMATKVPFEYGAKDFNFGDGFKALVNGKIAGFKALYNSFIKTPKLGQKDSNWLNINHSGYKRIFGIFATLLLVIMTWISFDYNITWDEPNHNTFSKDVLKYYTSFGSDTTMFDFQKAGHRDYFTNVYYGMSIDVFSAAVNDIIGAKNEFATRHFFNSIVGFLCILFAALTVRLFTGWLPALITLLALTCSPSFFGHCFNNPKDIPFAAGYIMAIFYTLRLIKELPNPRHQTKVMLAIAIGFAISIRAGGLLLIFYLALAALFHFIYTISENKKVEMGKVFWKYFKTFGLVALAGYIIGIIMWPYALRQPLTGAIKALREFEKFSYLTYYELFEGTRQYIKPWHYEPKLIMITAPLAIVGGLILGTLLGWFKQGKLKMIMFGLLFFMTLFPAVYAIYKGSYVYNGWRHFIFIYPSLVAIAMIGWYQLAAFIKNQKAGLIVLILVAVTFIKPGLWSILNHPYQYMYFNELAGGIKGANGNYELDYWNQSPRQAFQWLVDNHPEILDGNAKVSSNNIQESLKTFVPKGQEVKYAWTREYEWADNDWKYAIWTSRTLSKSQIINGYWPPKGTIYEVKVDGVTVAAVVKSENDYSFLGKKYLKKNMADSALYFYEKAYAYNPLEEEFARGVANACKLGGKTDSAIQFYTKAIALRDGNYEAYNSLGELYFMKAYGNNSGNVDMALMDKAYENFSLAFKHKKNSSAPLYMGEILLMKEKAEEARDYYSAFLTTYGDAAAGYLGLGKAYMAMRNNDSSEYNLQVAIQLDPKNPQAYQLLINSLKEQGRSQEAEQILNLYMKNVGAGATQ
ncbi:MAG: glycosyltransferase family 39 protein [Bacteroidia bacterium]|nr:glycosyltransferase family 39 protein [Bacteroidia bacterium]